MTVPKFASTLVCLLVASVTFVSASPLRRQRSRPLLHVGDALKAEVPVEQSDDFDSEYGRMLRDDYSLSMSMTNAPMGQPTSEPTRVLPSDFPSLISRSLEPSGVVASDFPSLSPSDAPTEGAASPSPTEVAVSHTDIPSSSPTEPAASDAPSLSPTETPSRDTLAPSSSPSSSPTEPLESGAPSLNPTENPASAPSSSPTEIPASDALAPSSSPTEIPASDALAPSSSPTEIPASDALAPSSSPTEIPASDALAPSSSPSSDPTLVSGALLRRQRSRSLLNVRDADKVEAPLEEIAILDFEYGRMLRDDYSLSMSMTNAPVGLPTSEPTRVLPSDFPSLSPSDSPTEAAASPSPTEAVAIHTDVPSSSPTEAVVSHTEAPSSSPTEIPASDALAPSSSPSSSPTEIPASDALAPSWSPSSAPTRHSGIPNPEWLQVGKPIVPILEGLLGTDIAMSADGSVIAVGIPGSAPGYIGVYRYNETTSEWDMVGGEIFDVIGEGSVRFGSTVAISADGMTVAGGSGYSNSALDVNGLSEPLAGRAQVNVYENGRWAQKGQSLVGTQCRSLGWATALSGDGNRWVVGTPDVSGSGDARCSDIDFGAERGIVQVFDFVNGGEWAQVGSIISGSQPGSQLGQAVAISRNGLRIATFSQGIADTDPYYQVFEQDEFGSWVQMGGEIAVESAIATSSTNTLALSASGNRIVITSKRRASGIGYFKVLEWTSETSTWTQLGPDVEDVDGCCFFFAYDTSVAMSDSGTKVVYGNTGYRDGIGLGDDTSFFRGNVRVFEWIDGAWQQVGGSILGDDLFGEIWFGYSTAMSADGRRIAASAPIAFPNYVAAYELPYN